MKLTTLQFKLLQGIDHSEYGNVLMDGTWTFSVLDNSDITARQLPGVLAGALKAGLINVGGTGGRDDEFTVTPTELGAKAYAEECTNQGVNTKKPLSWAKA